MKHPSAQCPTVKHPSAQCPTVIHPSAQCPTVKHPSAHPFMGIKKLICQAPTYLDKLHKVVSPHEKSPHVKWLH